MNRFTTRLADKLEYGLWLAFDEDGGVTMTRGKPSLKRGQRAMALSIALPIELFKTPELSATIQVAKPNVDSLAINTTAAADALSKAIGLPVDIRVVGDDQ